MRAAVLVLLVVCLLSTPDVAGAAAGADGDEAMGCFIAAGGKFCAPMGGEVVVRQDDANLITFYPEVLIENFQIAEKDGSRVLALVRAPCASFNLSKEVNATRDCVTALEDNGYTVVQRVAAKGLTPQDVFFEGVRGEERIFVGTVFIPGEKNKWLSLVFRPKEGETQKNFEEWLDRISIQPAPPIFFTAAFSCFFVLALAIVL